MQLWAPAKINLSFHISRRRPDGFHEIETLIAPISLYDTIDIEKQNRWIDFSCDDASLPAGAAFLLDFVWANPLPPTASEKPSTVTPRIAKVRSTICLLYSECRLLAILIVSI